jgi:hypothetical protein
MNKFRLLTKRSIGFYTNLAIYGIAAISIAVAMIFSAVSSSDTGFAVPKLWLAILLSIFSIILLAGIILIQIFLPSSFGQKIEKKWWFDLSITLALMLIIAFLGICFYIMAHGKSSLMGAIWFSGLFTGNGPAEAALMGGTIGMVLYVFAGIMLGVGAFFKITQK